MIDHRFPYFKEYVSNLPPKEARCFHHHLSRYLIMFSHQAGFEVSSTTRYTGTMEACILATRDWEAGESVDCCSGAITELTKEDDAKLKSEGRDFSVMVSTRKKCTCLFLGPARFMNHDCDANCEFTLLNSNTISFKVQRDIRCGEEMTVYYGDHYFGIDNCECRCLSCERMQEGSFRVEKSDSEETEKDDTVTPETPTEDENTGIRRSGRTKKEVDYIYKDVLSSPKRQKATLPKPNKVEPVGNNIPLIEITNGQSLEDTIEYMTIDDPRDMEIGQSAKKQKPVEMDLNFICNDPPSNHWLTRTTISNTQLFAQRAENTCTAWKAQKTSYASMSLIDNYGQSPLSSHPSKTQPPITRDPDLVQVYDWIDDQSDVSDTEGSIITDFNVATCCDAAKEYMTVITSNGRELCSRCYRHYKIYDVEWPSRKKPISIPPPLQSSTPPPLRPSSPSKTEKPSNPKPRNRGKAKSTKPTKPRPKPKPKSPQKTKEKQPPIWPKPPLPKSELQSLAALQPTLQPCENNPVIASFARQPSSNYLLSSLSASPTFTPTFSFSQTSPSPKKLQLSRPQKVYAIPPRSV
ncbi:histone lysine methyltransferase Set9, variant 2 [Mucor circinelloides]